MQSVQLFNVTTQELILDTVWLARYFPQRLRGLLFRRPLAANEGLVITPCGSVHTCLMTYPLDIVYFDHDWKVIKIVEHLKPWRFSACSKAYGCLEVKAGVVAKNQLSVGMSIEAR